jgi:YHS domain-containing protein
MITAPTAVPIAIGEQVMTDTSDRSFGRACGVALVAALVAFAWSASASAGSSINTGYFGGVAIEGYDTVAYFTDGKATRGSEEFAYDWLGVTWLFANAEHRDLFAEQPVQYAPQYGGHCAMGTAFGRAPPTSTPKPGPSSTASSTCNTPRARGRRGSRIAPKGSRRPIRNGRRLQPG